jgi:hypothetical protein
MALPLSLVDWILQHSNRLEQDFYILQQLDKVIKKNE